MTGSVLAQDYTLQQAENHHYRDYTREEMVSRFGENGKILPHYQCNGKDEFDPFWPAVRQNEKEDSLRIRLYKSEEMIVYRKGNYYKLNGKPERNLSDRFVKYVKDALEKIEAVPEGAALLRHLERSHFPLTITFGGNMFNPKEEKGPPYKGIYMANALAILDHGRMSSENILFYDIGVGGDISWNPKTEGLPPYVALAHEMYHAFDSIRGLIDMRFVVGEHYEHAFVSEYRAVWFENIFRKAEGLPYRTHYGQESSGPGLLDEHGEPRKMPSPCLK